MVATDEQLEFLRAALVDGWVNWARACHQGQCFFNCQRISCWDWHAASRLEYCEGWLTLNDRDRIAHAWLLLDDKVVVDPTHRSRTGLNGEVYVRTPGAARRKFFVHRVVGELPQKPRPWIYAGHVFEGHVIRRIFAEAKYPMGCPLLAHAIN